MAKVVNCKTMVSIFLCSFFQILLTIQVPWIYKWRFSNLLRPRLSRKKSINNENLDSIACFYYELIVDDWETRKFKESRNQRNSFKPTEEDSILVVKLLQSNKRAMNFAKLYNLPQMDIQGKVKRTFCAFENVIV